MPRQYFSFGTASLVETQAHAGCGSVRTTRVIDAAQGSGFQFIDLTEIPPGCSVGVHRHGDDEEVYVIIEGRGRMHLEGESFEVGPGDVIRNLPGGAHGLENSGSEPLRMVVLDVASH